MDSFSLDPYLLQNVECHVFLLFTNFVLLQAIYPRNEAYDPASDPAQFGNVWTPWMESC